MAIGVYKPGQGYWTRVGTAVGIAIVGLTGAFWLWGELETVRLGNLEPVITQAIAAGVITLFTALITYYLVGLKPKTNEFLISVDQEMKKVNWSTRREIIGSTYVVIFIAAALAVIIYTIDLLLAAFFNAIDLLQLG
ncbi:MAG: preprotein translocase subunit SecE [Phycisphaeraceae bacterium]|nr:preprotein translocase subunit SecE [Phycisphaeraceae bacterium]